MLKEIWKSIPGYEGLYEASNLGRIRSLDRVHLTYQYQAKKKVKRKIKGRVLAQGNSRHPLYKEARLSKDGIAKTLSVHILILQAFVGLCPKGMECSHKNGNASDNRIENLEWTTRKENAQLRIVHGTQVCGSRVVHKAILNESDVVTIKRLLRRGIDYKEIATAYRVRSGVIHAIKSNRTWKHVI